MGPCGRRHGGAGRLLRLSNADLGSFVHHGTNFSDFGMLWTVSAAPFGGFHRGSRRCCASPKQLSFLAMF